MSYKSITPLAETLEEIKSHLESEKLKRELASSVERTESARFLETEIQQRKLFGQVEQLTQDTLKSIQDKREQMETLKELHRHQLEKADRDKARLVKKHEIASVPLGHMTSMPKQQTSVTEGQFLYEARGKPWKRSRNAGVIVVRV